MEILREYETLSTIAVTVMVAGITMAVTSLILFIKERFESKIFFLTLIVVGLALTIVGIFAFQPSRKIEVMLSDDYPAIELLENYKVIEQKEGIYTLEPLEKVDE